MRPHSFAQYRGLPKSKLELRVNAKPAPVSVKRQATLPAAQARSKQKSVDFSHLQPVADGEAHYRTTDTATAILAAATKARTPTSRKPPAAGSVVAQVIAAGKKRRGEV
jgi:hypothetical protein